MPKIILIRKLRVVGDIAYVPLTKGKEAIIDAELAPLVGQYNWYAEQGYKTLWYAARGGGKGKSKVLLHRQILGAKPGEEVDHEDGDGLNCRRSNIRIATHQENMRNRAGWAKSGLPKGVVEFNGGYTAMICIDGKRYQLGGIVGDPAEASATYELFAEKMFGEFYRPPKLVEAAFIPNAEKGRRVVGYDWRGDPIYGNDHAPLQKGVKREKSK